MGVPSKGIYVFFGSMLEPDLSTKSAEHFEVRGGFGYRSGRMDGFVLGSSETRRLFQGEANQVTAITFHGFLQLTLLVSGLGLRF